MKMSPTMTGGRVKCRLCNTWFENEQAWAANTTCDKPNECYCPEIKKSMRKATDTINAAKKNAGYTVFIKEETIRTNRDESVEQLETPVAPLFQMEIKKRKGR